MGTEFDLGVLKETLATMSSKIILQYDMISQNKFRIDRIECKFCSMFRDFEQFKDVFARFFQQKGKLASLQIDPNSTPLKKNDYTSSMFARDELSPTTGKTLQKSNGVNSSSQRTSIVKKKFKSIPKNSKCHDLQSPNATEKSNPITNQLGFQSKLLNADLLLKHRKYLPAARDQDPASSVDENLDIGTQELYRVRSLEASMMTNAQAHSRCSERKPDNLLSGPSKNRNPPQKVARKTSRDLDNGWTSSFNVGSLRCWTNDKSEINNNQNYRQKLISSTSKMGSGFEPKGSIDTALLMNKTQGGKTRQFLTQTKIDRVPKKVAGNIIKKCWYAKDNQNKYKTEQFPNTIRLDS